MSDFNQLITLAAMYFQGFVLIASRVSGLVLTAPILGNLNVPAVTRIGLVLFISGIVLPFIKPAPMPGDALALAFILAISRELLIGIIFGFCVRLIFIGIQIAGEIIDYQMGFGFVNIVDPESRVQVPIIGQFLYIVSILIFLGMNGHHWMIRAIVDSYNVLPIGSMKFSPEFSQYVVTLFVQIFVIAFKISAPLAMLLFLMDLAYGVFARAVPQANILVIGFPLKIGLGLFFLWLFMPVCVMILRKYFGQILFELNGMFTLFKGSF